MPRSAPKPPRSSPSTPPRGGMLPFYVLLGVVALAGIGVLVWQLNDKAAAVTQPVQVSLTPEQLNRVQGISIGEADAPVVVMEFADFQCPGCAQFAQFTAPLIKQRLVESGKVRFVFYEFPLPQHQNAFLAARAGRCANEQGRFWDFHDVLFGQQSDWAFERDPVDLFVGYAGRVGADTGAFEQCLRSDRFAREVSESAAFGTAMGVSSTPTLIVNGKRIPTPREFSELEEIVNREAGGAAAPAPAGDAAPAAAPAS